MNDSSSGTRVSSRRLRATPDVQLTDGFSSSDDEDEDEGQEGIGIGSAVLDSNGQTGAAHVPHVPPVDGIAPPSASAGGASGGAGAGKRRRRLRGMGMRGGAGTGSSNGENPSSASGASSSTSASPFPGLSDPAEDAIRRELAAS